jgi:hypothetical protein
MKRLAILALVPISLWSAAGEAMIDKALLWSYQMRGKIK